MPTTLISSIGRGRKDSANVVYQRCAYHIEGIAQAPTSFFVEAWLQSRQGCDIDQVELIGTATSSWSALLENSEETDLWATLEAKCDKQDSAGVSTGDLVPLAAHLSRTWSRRVRCHVLAQTAIDDSNATTILEQLIGLFPLDDPARELQLDTTHGLRTLPLLALSAVQSADALCPGFASRTRLIYGELMGEQARGFAFDAVLRWQQTADATRAFFDAFDGEPLARQLEPDCPRLAAAIRNLSGCLQANLFDQLEERLSQLKNALPEAPYPLLKSRLTQLCQKLAEPTLPRKLLALARLRAERRHYGAAIMALAEAATALACVEPVQSFEDMKEQGNLYKKTLNPRMRKSWDELFKTRNRIAHGANLIPQDGRLNHQNLRPHYERYEQLLHSLIS